MNKCIYCQNPEAFQLEPASMIEVPWTGQGQIHKEGEIVLGHKDKIWRGFVICKNHIEKRT